METSHRTAPKQSASFDAISHDFRPSKVQIIRRLSMETYMVRIYAGPLSQECDFVAVEAEKATPAIDIVQVAARKLRLSGSVEKFELAEVFSSGGQLCKERRLEDMDTPVGIQLLWPKVINAELDKGMGLFTGYRFYIRRKDPEVSRSGWVECKDGSGGVVDTFLMSFLQQPVGSKEYQDLCNLPDLNETTLMCNLKARFSSSKIYTYVGSILIALNPFKFFPIYNPKYVKMYQNRHLGELPPHIFAIADAAYHSMLQMRQNQCIVISGESGSGKTESTNLLLHHLTALSQKGLHGSGVEQTILGAGPVLEAFGNAKTVHNNNSSRFGKFIQVNYKENGMVHGAIVEKYLLEKSRIVSQAKNERNYHVFYYMLAGADEKERETLDLSRPEDYKYLSHSQCFTLEGVDEEHEFARLRQSMEMVGFSPETQRKIFCVLSAVLHLGNIDFKKKGDQHHDESVTVRNEETVKIISNLLKVKERTVLEALTQKRTTAGDETFTINFKMEEAVATRDAMAKCIYGALFDWIVLKVNQALLAKKHNSEHEGNSIGVLDIFGFEDFGRNSFEQFCINYANEHLQYYFNQHIFKFEQEEYQREGIQWKNIEFIDNTGCLEIFSKRPSGLFHLLDEECNFPGATNDTLLTKFTHNHRGNPYYQVPQLKEGAFNILHYAGKVKYFVKDFREKNSDLVRPEIVSTMKKSSMTFVRELMGIDPVAVLRWSVVRAFFRCFFAFISAGERYRKNGGAEKKVRNRLSDSHLQETAFSENLLRAKKRQRERDLAASTMASLHDDPDPDLAMTSGSEGNDFDLVCSRRQVLHEELMMYSSMETNLPPSDAKVIRRARRLLMKNKSFKPRPKPSLSFRDIKALKAIASRTMFGGGRVSSKKQPPSVSAQFQWSLGRLMNTLNQANPFFIRCIKSNSEKAPCQFDDEVVLRQLRYTGMLATVKIRQSGYNYRLLFEEFIQLYQILLPKGLVSSQEDVKTFLYSMQLNMDNCQIGKNKVFLRESEKLLLDEALHTAIMRRVVFIQRWVKSRLERRSFLRLRDAVIVLQKHMRRLLAMRLLHRLQSEQDAAITVQRVYRGWRVRKAFYAYRITIICLQSHIRAMLCRQRFLMEKRALLDRQLAEQEAEKTREQLQRQLQEELQSTASDEGVMLKGSSAEELEEREFEPVAMQRRDSEESSGILEDSDAETAPSQRQSLSSLPASLSSAPLTPEIQAEAMPTLPSQATHTSYIPAVATPTIEMQAFFPYMVPAQTLPTREIAGVAPPIEHMQEVAPATMEMIAEALPTLRVQAVPSASDYTATPRRAKTEAGRREVYLVEAGSGPGGGRVHELARNFQSAPQRDQEQSPPKDELYLDVITITSPPPTTSSTTGHNVSPENLQTIKEVIAKGRPSHLEPHDLHEESRGASLSDPSTHLSPLHKARKHFKNFMGGLHLPDMHLHSRSCVTHDSRSRRKKDTTDSDEEGEDSQHSPSAVSSPIKKITDMGMFVLPTAACPTVALPSSSPTRKDHPVMLAEDRSKQVPQMKRKKKQQRRRSQGSGGQPIINQSRSNVNFYGTSEWQYSDDMKITDVQDLHLLDEFISQKCRELFKGGTRRDTIFDKIFRGALEEFGRELKTVIGVEMQHDEVSVKYRDLFEKFKQVLTAEMRKEHTEAPLVMALNAFRGFLDEFMKQHSGRRRDKEKKEDRSKVEKPVKRDKQKKDMVEHLGHKFLQVQFSIPTFCELCSSLIWIMDKGQVCQVCKYTCHKKCSIRSISVCRGSSSGQNASNARVFGAPLESLLKEGNKIPLVVERLINAIEMHGLFTEGLYRKSASAPKARELRALLESDFLSVNLEEYPVHTLTTVMKAFFRELPEPLLTFELYDDFLRGAEIKDRKEQVQCMFAVIEKLPKANYDLFERLTFHLAKVAMHEDSTKMSVNGLAIIFAPCLLRSSKKVQAQDSLNQVPKQTSCIEVILSEELATVRSKLEDISTLESAEKTAEERLSFVRASLKKSRVKADLQVPLSQGLMSEDDTDTSQSTELAAEARALTAHIATIHKERKDLTSKLPVLETRQASSDEDMLTGDETDSVFDSMDNPSDNNEEYAVAFDLPANAPFLHHVTKGRVPIPSRRRLPQRYSSRLARRHTLRRQAAIRETMAEPPPTIRITEHSSTAQSSSPYFSTMTVPESDYVNVPGIREEEDDEIMV